MKQVFTPLSHLKPSGIVKHGALARATVMLGFLSVGFASPLFAQQAPAATGAEIGAEIGKATEIVKSVDLLADGNQTKLIVGSKIRTEETLVTGEDSTGQFEMVDKTTLAVGPNSELWLDKFVYDPNPSKREVVVVHFKGAIRFLTGDNPSETYKIKTPTATIGVRGTKFDVYINDDGQTIVALLEGRVNVCRSQAQAKRTNQTVECRGLQQPGRFLVVKKQGRIRLYNKLPKELLDRGGFPQAFPFLGGRFRLRGKMAASPITRQNIRQYAGLPLEARPKPKRKTQTPPRRKKAKTRDKRKRKVVNTRTPRRTVPIRVRPRAERPQYEQPQRPRDRVFPKIPIQIGIGIFPGRKRRPESGYPTTGPSTGPSHTFVPRIRISPTIQTNPKKRVKYKPRTTKKKSKRQRRKERDELRRQRLRDTRH